MLSGQLIVSVVALVVFGGKRISDLGAGLGKGIRNFKKGLQKEDPKSRVGKMLESEW